MREEYARFWRTVNAKAKKKQLVGTGRFELPICGRERGNAERESASEILSDAPTSADPKDLTPAPLARFYSCVSAALRRDGLGVLAVGSDRPLADTNIV